MKITSFRVNNIQYEKELSISESKPTTDWDVAYECHAVVYPNPEFILQFITVSISYYKAGKCAKMAVKTSFMITKETDQNTPTDPNDMFKYAEMIVVAKSHARALFHARTKQTLFEPAQTPYITLEEELGNIDPNTFRLVNSN